MSEILDVSEPRLPAHLDYLRLRNQRPRSIRERRYAVLRAARQLGHPVADVTRAELQAWQLSVLERVTPAGLHNETVHVAQYLRWLVLAGLREEDPTAVLVRPQHLNDRLPRPLADADVAHAMATAGQPERAWIALAAFCGLRCCEIAPLAVEDIVEGTVPFLRIIGKGGRQRIVPLPVSVLAELRDAGMPRRGHIFTRMDGQPGPPSATRVSERLAKCLREAGVNGTGHQLRHRFGSALYAATKDPYLVAEVMGHRSTETTKGYVAINPSAAAAPMELISRLTEHTEGKAS
jgi:integrase